MASWLTALLQPEGSDVGLIKCESRSRVELRRLNQGRFICKHIRMGGWKYPLYRLVNGTPACREWRRALQLGRLGIRVCQPLALVEGSPMLWGEQALILPYVDGMPLNHLIKTQTDGPMRRAVAAAVGAQAGGLTALGLVNRDHKANNLIVDEACRSRGAEPVLIDPAGVRRYRSHLQVHRMFARLFQTAFAAGPVTIRERLTCLQNALKADPSLAPPGPRRLANLARRIRAVVK